MRLLKRIVTSIHAGVDRTVTNMENHGAVVDAALKQSREAVVRAKVRLAQLEKEGRKQQDRITELTSEVGLWTERARSSAEHDRQKAMACLQRRKQREQELANARERIKEHRVAEDKIRSSIDESANRMQALQAQRNQMRSREAAAQAGAIVNALDDRMCDDVEAAFERWEIKVGQCEIMNDTQFSAAGIDTYRSTDELADEFNTAEENQLLEAELEELLNKGDDDNE